MGKFVGHKSDKHNRYSLTKIGGPPGPAPVDTRATPMKSPAAPHKSGNKYAFAANQGGNCSPTGCPGGS